MILTKIVKLKIIIKLKVVFNHYPHKIRMKSIQIVILASFKKNSANYNMLSFKIINLKR